MTTKSLDDNWENIWSNKDISQISKHKIILKKLMIATGHVGKNKNIDISSWKTYSKKILKILSPKKKFNLFEVGCGAGALLYLLKKNYSDYSGCDYSKNLIQIALKYFDRNKIFYKNAKNLDVKKKFDHVIASSVFEYLSHDVSKKVLNNMTKKSKKKILISEILNHDYRNKFLKQFKKKKNSKINYSFYKKSYFLNFAKKKKLKITFFPSLIPYSKQKKYRYTVLLSK
tara:strand:- start:19 stop:705 length:687 start_codon:yes stop_codon:yes gene_type:complete